MGASTRCMTIKPCWRHRANNPVFNEVSLIAKKKCCFIPRIHVETSVLTFLSIQTPCHKSKDGLRKCKSSCIFLVDRTKQLTLISSMNMGYIEDWSSKKIHIIPPQNSCSEGKCSTTAWGIKKKLDPAYFSLSSEVKMYIIELIDTTETILLVQNYCHTSMLPAWYTWITWMR